MSEEQQYEDGTGNELAIRQQTTRTVDMRDRSTDSWTAVVSDVIRLASVICTTEFVPRALRCSCPAAVRADRGCQCGGEARTTAAMLYGRELGLAPMTGLGSVDVIEGKAGTSAEMKRALIHQAGHEFEVVKSDRNVCEVRGRRMGQEGWTTATWTIQEAAQVQVKIGGNWTGLNSKAVWKSYPAEMLLARATTRLARMIFADVTHGMRSTEELQDMSSVEDVAEDAPEVPKVQRKQTTARKPQPATPVQEEASEAPARRTVGRPAPRGGKAAEPQPEPQEEVKEEAPKVTTLPAEPQPDADGVVDAEIVEEDPPAKEDKARKGATTAAVMHFDRLDVKDRNERLWFTSIIAGREIASTNDLTLEELRQVVAKLERMKNIDALNALVDSSEKKKG